MTFLPGLVVAGTSSNSGKTLTTLALLCALRARGVRVAAAKIGPDFIDTAWHQRVTGLPVANLDIWMTGPRGLARLRQRMAGLQPDVCVAEGVMGLYDGTGGGKGSTAHVARQLDWPVLLLLPCRGQAQSVAAVAEGFLQFGGQGRRGQRGQRGPNKRFAGMLCTFVGGPRHRELLTEALAPVARRTGVPLLGLLPRDGAPQLPSRHLGLVAVEEAQDLLAPTALTQWFETNCDVPRLLERLGVRQDGKVDTPETASMTTFQARTHFPTDTTQGTKEPRQIPRRRARRTVRIGIAHDAAFRFCYADLPALLQDMGAEPLFFSPLRDNEPPADCAGLYFPGGYPELYARQLAANAPMLDALRQRARQGLPMYGECGGFIYLMRELVDHNGACWPMADLLPLACRMGTRWAALGYRLCDGTHRGHEFHYGELVPTADPISPDLPASADSTSLGAPLCAPLWQSVRDGSGNELGPQGCRADNVCGSWIHLAPEGARGFWRAWIKGLPHV